MSVLFFVRVCVVERLIAKVAIGGSTRLPWLGLGGKHEVSDGPGQDLNPDRRGWRDRRNRCHASDSTSKC